TRVPHLREDDRDHRCLLLCRGDLWGPRRDNDIHLEPDELGRDLCGALGASLCPTNLYGDGARFNPAEFTQPLYESSEPLALGRRRALAQESDGRQLRHLLGARGKWPRRRAAECSQQFPPSDCDCPTPSRARCDTTPRVCCPNCAATRRRWGARRAQAATDGPRQPKSMRLFFAAPLHFAPDLRDLR